MMFKDKSEFQIVLMLIKFTLLMAILGSLLFFFLSLSPLVLLATFVFSLLYFLVGKVEKNYERIALMVEETASNFEFLKFTQMYSVTGILSLLLLFFNLMIVLILWFGRAYCPSWCGLLLLILLAGGFYFGIIFGFSSLFNQTKKRFFGIVGFIGHLIALAILGYFIFMAIMEFLGMMFFGLDMTIEDKYTPEEKFQIVLLLESIPPSVHDLEVNGAIQGWLTSMTLTYKAESRFFEMLEHREPLKNASEWDQPIHKVPCRDTHNSQKICYSGVVFPFVHNILYSPKTKEVIDSVTGMRD